ncbi:MAG: topoisomerase protein [Candidatus Nomurabacteria bacterium GW2011_GWC2_35_35]|nr:MAG: topoisomerase protein [Candidatus Nomurabacteria bacterium GW2011_GWC2_35_35]
MEREREIRAFVSEKYWKILGLFETLKKGKLTLFCSEEPRDEKLVEKILEEGKKGNWLVKEIKESEQKRVPRAPFTTSTLQQTASSRLGYSPSRTMHIAQKLYEAGHITYMRTDSTNLSYMGKNIPNREFIKLNQKMPKKRMKLFVLPI